MNKVLLLHGALGSETQLITLKKALESEGFRVYTLNFSGHGGIPFRESFGIEAFSADVLEFLDSQQIKQVDIFGYSMGGYVALWFALHHPERVRKIITLGTKFDWSPDSAALEVQKLDPEKIAVKVPAFARLLEQRHAPQEWKTLTRKTSAMMLSLGDKPLLDELAIKAIEHPVLILLGDRDDMADKTYTMHVTSTLSKGIYRCLENTPHPIEKVELTLLLNHIQNFFRS